MNRFASVLIVSFLCCSFYGFSQSSRDQQVEQLAMEFVACFEKPKAAPFETFENLLADDFIQVASNGKVIVGKDANLNMYREALEEIDTLFDHIEFDFEIQSVKLVRKKTAIVFGVVRSSGMLKSGQEFGREIHETLVFTRKGRQWLLTHEHSSRIQ